jgi:hypothetical protein
LPLLRRVVAAAAALQLQGSGAFIPGPEDFRACYSRDAVDDESVYLTDLCGQKEFGLYGVRLKIKSNHHFEYIVF